MNNQNQTKIDAGKVISNLLNKLTSAEYNQAILETQVSELQKENEQLKSVQESKDKENG
jgi:hypothetical protein